MTENNLKCLFALCEVPYERIWKSRKNLISFTVPQFSTKGSNDGWFTTRDTVEDVEIIIDATMNIRHQLDSI